MRSRFIASILVFAAAGVFTAYRITAQPPARVVNIAARKFEFAPKEVTLKRGETVVLHLTSLDRPHGFLQKDLGIDADIVPSKPVDVTLRPTASGRYTVICDDYCGSGHGNMKMVLVVE